MLDRYTQASLALAFLFSLTAPICAQTHTIPAGFGNREGDGSHWVPSHYAPCRSQTTYDSSVIDFPTGMMRSISLRPDGGSPTSIDHIWSLTVHLSSADVPTPIAVDPTQFSANRGTDRVAVAQNLNIRFPSHVSAGGPEAWNVAIPIQPFMYQQGRNLQVEFEVDSPIGGPGSIAWLADAETYATQLPGGRFRRTGASFACPRRDTQYAGSIGGPGERASIWNYSLSGNNLPALCCIGSNLTSSGGMRLPLDLTRYGHPGCNIYTNVIHAIPGFTDPTGDLGRFRVDFIIPNRPTLAGMTFYSQNFVYDSTFGGGLRASDHARVEIGPVVRPLGAKHLYSFTPPLSNRPEFTVDVGLILGIN